jgi:hypothetical protein
MKEDRDMVTRGEQIVYLTEWASQYGATLQLNGQVGFGRDATGILKGDNYIDTGDMKNGNYVGPWWEPEDSYHKHDCLCVLGHGDEALTQLYEWVRWLEANDYGIEEVSRRPTSQIDLLFHGVSTPRLVKLAST